jgi:hypothetical protein
MERIIECDHIWIELKDGALCAVCDAQEDSKGRRVR